MPLSTIHTLVITWLASLPGLHPPAQRRGRPRIDEDSLILTLWLYQTLHRLSYREVLSTAQRQGFTVPSFRAYHYRVHRLDAELVQRLIEAAGKRLAGAETTPLETPHCGWHRLWLWSEVPAEVDARESAQAGEFACAFGEAGGGG